MGSKKNGSTVEKTIVPFDASKIVKVTEIPPRGKTASMAKDALKAIEGKKGIFIVREYESPSSASAFARSLKKLKADACSVKGKVYVTQA